MQAERLAATFSVVGRDPVSATLGIAVASHSFAVGSRVPWAGERFEATFQAIAGGEFDAARTHFTDAQTRHPENAEYGFWAGVSLPNAGYVEEGIAWLQKAFAAHPCWRELIARLPGAGMLADDAQLSEWIRHGAL